jgi:hypothetical protein
MAPYGVCSIFMPVYSNHSVSRKEVIHFETPEKMAGSNSALDIPYGRMLVRTGKPAVFRRPRRQPDRQTGEIGRQFAE